MIRQAKTSDYEAMDAVFRASAKQLCVRDYAASKGAVDTLTKGLSLEMAAEGIRVNCVRPGFIYTDIHSDGGEPNRVDRLSSIIPMQRGGKAEEVAEAIYWLASDTSSFTTGSFLDLTGGL